MIILSDTNCDFTKTNNDQLIDSNARHIANVYGLFNLLQLYEDPTRVTLNAATIIDHISATTTRNIIKLGVHMVALSDHYMVYCIRKVTGGIEKDYKTIKIRSMKHVSGKNCSLMFPAYIGVNSSSRQMIQT